MRVCGVTISGSDAVLVTISKAGSEATFIPLEPKRISLNDHKDQASVKAFVQNVDAYMRVNEISNVFIKTRAGGGQFAAGPAGLKIEALIQSLTTNVGLLSALKVANYLKKSSLPEADIYQYQVDALAVACCGAASLK